MFSELPKLFDRDYAVGYFLPVAAFVGASVVLLSWLKLLPNVQAFFETNILLGTTLLGLLSWLGGIVLLAANRDLIRFMEGYGKFNPLQLLRSLEVRRFNRLHGKIKELDRQYSDLVADGKEAPRLLRAKRNRLLREAVERFPDDQAWLLPTSFGNTIRAFEVYPRIMYGIESIQGWNRLLAVVPKENASLVNAAKATTDFWLNVGLLSWIFVAEVIIATILAGQRSALWFAFGAILVALIVPSRARSSAVEWGDLVKSCFDVYLIALSKKLGLVIPDSREEERQLWKFFSQAIIYGLPDSLPERRLSTASEPGSEHHNC